MLYIGPFPKMVINSVEGYLPAIKLTIEDWWLWIHSRATITATEFRALVTPGRSLVLVYSDCPCSSFQLLRVMLWIFTRVLCRHVLLRLRCPGVQPRGVLVSQSHCNNSPQPSGLKHKFILKFWWSEVKRGLPVWNEVVSRTLSLWGLKGASFLPFPAARIPGLVALVTILGPPR